MPPGVDADTQLEWTLTISRLARELTLMGAGLLLLAPPRITPRKNIAMALDVLHELRAISASDDRLNVTGPPGPHNPANEDYLDTCETDDHV